MNAASAISALRLSGRVVRPGDPDWDTASTPWNHRIAQRPAAVAYARSTDDVVAAVEWAHRHDIEFRVRSGDHTLVDWSAVQDGLVIDLSGLKAVTVRTDPHGAAPTALLGAGLTQGEAVTAVGRFGLVVPVGNEASMGLVGAVLAGGFGPLSRRFGLLSDQLLGAEVVISDEDGQVQTICVDNGHHADLLWALRGGGHGGLGIVTSLLVRTHPLTSVVLVTARWTGLGELPELFATWQETAPGLDHRLTSQLVVRRDGVELLAVMVEGDERTARALLAPVLAHGRPQVTTVERPWSHVLDDIQVPADRVRANWDSTSQFFDRPAPAAAIEVIAASMERAPTADCTYFAQAFGGGILTSEPPGSSAFAHRGAWFYGAPGAGWGDRGGAPADPRLAEECLAWVADLSRALLPWGDGAYVNVPNPHLPDWEQAYWGANADRLRAVKTAYDPDDVFHHQQSSAPLRW